MSLPRMMLTPDRLILGRVTLTGPELHHLLVLRLHPGDEVLASDGQGREYLGRIVSLDRQGAQVDFVKDSGRQPESFLPVTLFQGLARGEKIDWVIQKTTELGVARIVPVICRRSQVVPQPGRHAKADRWHEIARQAARQSGRTRVPEIPEPVPFAKSLAAAKPLALILHEGSEPDQAWKKQFSSLARPNEVNLWVGPEGGFAPEEINQARAAGLRSVQLGPRILRAETAGVVAVALALFAWGDLGGEG